MYAGSRALLVSPGTRFVSKATSVLAVVLVAYLPFAGYSFSFEGKSKSGAAEVAQRHVVNNGAYGAFGARGMLSLQNYGSSSPVYDGNAYFTGTSSHPDTETMQMYASHPDVVAVHRRTSF